MSSFARTLAIKVEDYVTLRRSLGYAFQKQAATLRALVQYAKVGQLDGPLTRDMALNFVFSWEGTARSCHSARSRSLLLRVSRDIRPTDRGTRSARITQKSRHSATTHIDRR